MHLDDPRCLPADVSLPAWSLDIPLALVHQHVKLGAEILIRSD